MFTYKNTIFLLYLYFSFISLFSQKDKVVFEHLSTENGLSQGYVFAITQDKKGYMWFGTWDGLNKFDGIDFQIFKPDPENPYSLSNNGVTSIYEDKKGVLWVGTNGGGLNKIVSYKYIKNTDKNDDQTYSIPDGKLKFTQFRYDSSNSLSISNNNITSFAEDDFGHLWIGTYGGGLNKLYIDKEGKEKFISYLNDPRDLTSISDMDITTLLKDRMGSIWVGTNNGGLNYFVPSKDNPTKEKFIRFESSSNKSLSSNRISSIIEDQIGNIWIGTRGGGIFVLTQDLREKLNYNPTFIQLKTDPLNSYSLSSNVVECIYEDRKGTIWVGTINGLNKVELKNNLVDKENIRFYHFKKDPANPSSLSDNQIESIFEDRSGNLWIGTFNGINLLNLYKKDFKTFQCDALNRNTIPDNVIRSIYKDKENTIWIGSESGILSKISKQGSITNYFVNNGSISPLSASLENEFRKRALTNSPTNFNGILPGNFINSITEDLDGNLWIGGIGLFKYFKNQTSFKYYFPSSIDKQKSISGILIWNIITDKKGNIWIATSGGLNKYNSKNEQFEYFLHQSNDSNSISSNKTTVVLEDSKGNLWVGTENGLNLLVSTNKNSGKNIFQHFYHQSKNPYSISSDKISSLHEDELGNIWIGTEGGGINKLVENEKSKNVIFEHYNEKDGLPANTICGILSGDEEHIWISTTKGLSRFNVNTKEFRNYSQKEGIQSNEFRRGASFKNFTNELFFGGIKGFNSFFSDSIKDNPYEPMVVISDFKLFNKTVPIGITEDKRIILTNQISETKKIVLSYSDNVITFEFVALHYTDPQKNRYAYKLEGFEKEWIYTDVTKRYANYSNLPAGKYVFKVIASNNDNVWSKEGASIELIIKPPFYATWWAYILYALFILLVLFFIRYYTINQERLKTKLRFAELEATRRDEMSKKEQEVNQMKLRFFTNISHEFRTPLTLILGPIENILLNTQLDSMFKQQIDLVQRNAKHLLRLINQLMDFRKLEIGGIQLKASQKDIIAFIDRAISSFKYLATQKKISFNFIHKDQSIDLWFDRDMMEKIIYNLLSNSFKFTPDGGEITLTVIKKAVYNPFLLAKTQVNDKYPLGYVDIIVKDTGKGIPTDKIEKIFEQFYQVDNADKSKNEGTGIGLALTKELVDLLRGEILVESNMNQGSSFTIRLPLGNLHLAKDQIIEGVIPDESEPMDVSDLDPLKNKQTIANKLDKNIEDILETETSIPVILIVEDNADLRFYIKMSFADAYSIEEAEDGTEGYEKAIETIPDLIITDVMMPDMDGFDLTKKLKENENTCHIPIVMLTALTSDESKMKGYELGVDDYITKPFNTTILQTRIKNLIEQRQKLKESFSKGLIEEKVEAPVFSADKRFLEKSIELIEKHMSDANFSVEEFSDELGLSRAQLYRKIKGLTGQTVSEFVRIIRLKKSSQMIKDGQLTINEIMYKVGFSSQSYFTKCFRTVFGMSPSEYSSKNSVDKKTKNN